MIRSCLCSSRIIGRGSPTCTDTSAYTSISSAPETPLALVVPLTVPLAVPEMLPPPVLPQIEPPEVVAATVEEPPTVNPATPPPDLDS